MRNFYKLEGWNKRRDSDRRVLAYKLLSENNIPYYCPSQGHFRIESKKCHTLIFYPKTGLLLWKEFKRDKQHKFISPDEGKIIRKIKELL